MESTTASLPCTDGIIEGSDADGATGWRRAVQPVPGLPQGKLHISPMYILCWILISFFVQAVSFEDV